MTRAGRVFHIVCVITCMAASSASAASRVELSIRDGRVWLETDGATVSQILAEWARIGGTRIVNGERIAGEPLTLALRGVPELQALGVVLRSAGGFIASARPPGVTGAPAHLSSIDRIVVLPAGARLANPAIPAGDGALPAPADRPRIGSPAYPPPAFVPPPAAPAPVFSPSGGQRILGADGLPVPDDQEDAPPPAPPANPSPPSTSAAPRAVPTVPPGVAAPGILPPPARKPGQ